MKKIKRIKKFKVRTELVQDSRIHAFHEIWKGKKFYYRFIEFKPLFNQGNRSMAEMLTVFLGMVNDETKK